MFPEALLANDLSSYFKGIILTSECHLWYSGQHSLVKLFPIYCFPCLSNKKVFVFDFELSRNR